MTNTINNVNNGIIPNVTNFRYRIRNNLTNQLQFKTLSTGTASFFQFNTLASFTYGISYTIDVALYMFDVWQPYGPECIVFTPPVPAMSSTSCNIIVPTKNTLLYSNFAISLASYRFTLTNSLTGIPLLPVITPFGSGSTYYFRFNNIPGGYTLSTQYDITVSVKSSSTGDWSPESTACTVTSPSNYLRPSNNLNILNEEFIAICTPNPSLNYFNLEVKTTTKNFFEIKIYDILGKLIETKSIEPSDENIYKFGQDYPSGIYNVMINQGENSKSIKIIKQ